jgi:hypothetical protein
MKKRLSVPPTKSALLQVGRQVKFLEQGRQMLEKKRDLLTRLVYERLAQYRELRAQTVKPNWPRPTTGWASCRCAWAGRCCARRRSA